MLLLGTLFSPGAEVASVLGSEGPGVRGPGVGNPGTGGPGAITPVPVSQRCVGSWQQGTRVWWRMAATVVSGTWGWHKQKKKPNIFLLLPLSQSPPPESCCFLSDLLCRQH